MTDRGARPDISPQMAAIRAGTTISSINQDALELLDQTGTGTTH